MAKITSTPDEARIQSWIDIIRRLGQMGGGMEKTHVYPNALVADAVAPGLPAGYARVVGEDGNYTPAVVAPGLALVDGDHVNLMYIEGTEPIAFQHGSASAGSNSHNPVTLGAGSSPALALSVQELTLTIVTESAVEPGTMYAGMFWIDTA